MSKNPEDYEYPSPKPLKGIAARYVNVPSSFIFDLDVDAKDIATFIFLSVRRGLDNRVTFSLPDDLVKWNGFTPDGHSNGVNLKFANSLDKLQKMGYISDMTQSSSFYRLTFNSQKVYDECQTYSFAVLYCDEIEKVIQHKNTDKDKYLNIPTLLFVLTFFRDAIHRRPNRIRQLEDTPENRRKLVSVKASPENRLPTGSFEPAGLLILFICGEIHPFAQRCFAFSVAFVQIQIAV